MIVYLPAEATLAQERLRYAWKKLLPGNVLPASKSPWIWKSSPARPGSWWKTRTY